MYFGCVSVLRLVGALRVDSNSFDSLTVNESIGDDLAEVKVEDIMHAFQTGEDSTAEFESSRKSTNSSGEVDEFGSLKPNHIFEISTEDLAPVEPLLDSDSQSFDYSNFTDFARLIDSEEASADDENIASASEEVTEALE